MILSQLDNSNYSAPSSAKEEDSDAEVIYFPFRASTASRTMPIKVIGRFPATSPSMRT